MPAPLFLEPVFQNKIWGGRKLAQEFNYQLPAGKIGECWAISAHPHGPSKVINDPYSGVYLNELWRSNPKLFGYPQEQVFPLLTKILDAEANLSVQVHPDNAYALEHEGELGKTECWYIIKADPQHSKVATQLIDYMIMIALIARPVKNANYIGDNQKKQLMYLL